MSITHYLNKNYISSVPKHSSIENTIQITFAVQSSKKEATNTLKKEPKVKIKKK